MLHFTKISNLQKCVFLFAMMLLPMTMCSCGNSSRKKSQIQETEDQEQTSRQKYRFKVITTSTETEEYVESFSFFVKNEENYYASKRIYHDINMVKHIKTYKIQVVDANDKPVIFDPEGDYTDLVVPLYCASHFYASRVRRTGIKRYKYEYSYRYFYNQPEDGMRALNKQTELLEKYINYAWDLPLTNQPIDDMEIKEDFNRDYYRLDLKNHSIIEISRSYDEVVYGFLKDDQVLYNPNDLKKLHVERLPDNTIGYTMKWDVECYKGDKYPGKLEEVWE